MTVISKLDLDGKNITKYNNATISNINLDGANYHFAKPNLVDNGECAEAVEEPIIDMNIYGNSLNAVPSEYQRVEYLEGTGTQYINTGYVVKSNYLEIQSTIFTDVKDAEMAVFGSDQTLEAGFSKTDGRLFCYSASLKSSVSGTFNDIYNNVIEFGVKLFPTGRTMSVNEEKVSDTNNHSLIGDTLLLYSCYAKGYEFKGRIYNVKIYDNNALVRNFIPCVRKVDNELGLYDLVDGVFYTNAGTGTFLKGENIVPTTNGVGDRTKNFIKITEKLPYTQDGLTVSRNSDGSIRVKGTSERSTSLYLSKNTFTLKAGTYTLNNTDVAQALTYLLPNYTRGTFTITSDTTFTGCYINMPSSLVGQSLDFSFYPQLEEGRSFTNYEPYGYKIPIQKKGTTATEFEPFVEPVTTNIYLDEPLRKTENNVDMLNYKEKTVTRNVSNDNLPLDTPLEEPINVPTIETHKGTNIFEIKTAIQPSKLSVEYWKQI